MSRAAVGISGCAQYDSYAVERAVCRAVDAIGGIRRFVRPGMLVLLKPNLLTAKDPEQAVTTHPAVVCAVARLVRSAGGHPIVADSPGGPGLKGYLHLVYERTGMAAAAREGVFSLSDDTAWVKVGFPDGNVARSFCVLQVVAKADLVINLPKLKTHEFMNLTGAVKNVFGIIPGAHKAEYHLRMCSRRDFARMLVDLCRYVQPALTVMDAVVGMEGEGPSAGHPRSIGCIMASDDPFVLDVCAAEVIGMRPEDVPTVQVSVEYGWCPPRAAAIRYPGEHWERFVVGDFRSPSAHPGFFERLPGPLRRILRPKPVFSSVRCTGCGLCARACPPHAITVANGTAQVDGERCIRCFCCHELCPRGAVRIARGPVTRWMVR